MAKTLRNSSLVLRRARKCSWSGALLLEKKLDLFEPSPYLFFTIHLDGLKEVHDRSVAQEGVFDIAVDAIKKCKGKGFAVNRAERHELPLLHEPSHDRADLAMNQGLSTGNRDNGRSAFIGGVEALLDRQSLVEDRIRIVDLTAAGAGKIASKQWLKHQNERITLPSRKLLPQDIRRDLCFLEEWNHAVSPGRMYAGRLRLGPGPQAA
jgi:hypothetical protein